VRKTEREDCSAWRREGSRVSHPSVQIPGRRVQGRWSQAFFSGSQWWDERQWAQTEIQEILYKHSPGL